MRRTGFILAALGALGATLAACSDTARRGVTYLGPMAIDDPQVRLGQQIFMRECNQCHPGGEAGVGLALNDKPLPDFAIRAQVRLGLGAMPAFSEQEVSDEGLDAIVAYLDFLRARGPYENRL